MQVRPNAADEVRFKLTTCVSAWFEQRLHNLALFSAACFYDIKKHLWCYFYVILDVTLSQRQGLVSGLHLNECKWYVWMLVTAAV